MTSSKRAGLRRRQAARAREYKRLAKLGRLPQHTRAERLRAAAERRIKRAIELRYRKWRRRVAEVAFASAGGAAFVFTSPAAGATAVGHHTYSPIARYYAASALSGYDHDELPHNAESEPTLWSPFDAAGTARTFIMIGPVPSETWIGSNRYGPYGPSPFGD